MLKNKPMFLFWNILLNNLSKFLKKLYKYNIYFRTNEINVTKKIFNPQSHTNEAIQLPVGYCNCIIETVSSHLSIM